MIIAFEIMVPLDGDWKGWGDGKDVQVALVVLF